MGFFEKLKSGLTKTRQNFTDRISELVGMSAKVDEDFLEELEMILLTADVGVKTTEKLIENVRQAAKKKEIKGTEDVLPFLKKQIAAMLKDDGVRTRIGARPTVILVVGVNGVGKTTTIAKLASMLSLEKKLKCALVTSDTYRIAAVEQLTTYASILQIPLKTLYEPSAMKDALEEFKDYDVVLVDTAGRSHRNRQQRDDIEKLINYVPKELREIYLVLSVTTKYRDLLKITGTYSEVSDYKLIFTKLDETGTIGNILNIRMATGAPLSYSTFGQNVPDDISETDAQAIAKQLLGGSD